MSLMRVLFAEDDESQAELFLAAASEWNSKQTDRELEIVRAGTVETAKQQLIQMHLDAAIFDLRLPAKKGNKPSAKGGNDLARFSVKEVGIPIGVISGNPADLEGDLVGLRLVRAFNKGDEDVYAKTVAWVESEWKMMAVLASARTQIQSIGASIFVQRLWPRWKTYESLTGATSDELTQIVTRQFAGHIAEVLGLDGEGAVPWHPYECFIHPALLEARAQTGDLFDIDDSLRVVLTPACDMAAKKVDNVLLARVEKLPEADWNAKVAQLKQAGLSEKKQKERDNYFSRLVNQNVGPSEHFLPPLDNGPPMMVRFKDVSTRKLTWLNENLGLRVATIAPAFLPNLVQRFGAWISRTGQPNIDYRHFG